MQICSFCLFVCQTASIFYSLAKYLFGQSVPFHTVDLSRESRVVPPTLRFSRKRIKIIFRRRCRPRKLKSAKNNPHVFQTKPRKFGDAKISHSAVYNFIFEPENHDFKTHIYILLNCYTHIYNLSQTNSPHICRTSLYTRAVRKVRRQHE